MPATAEPIADVAMRVIGRDRQYGLAAVGASVAGMPELRHALDLECDAAVGFVEQAKAGREQTAVAAIGLTFAALDQAIGIGLQHDVAAHRNPVERAEQLQVCVLPFPLRTVTLDGARAGRQSHGGHRPECNELSIVVAFAD